MNNTDIVVWGYEDIVDVFGISAKKAKAMLKHESCPSFKIGKVRKVYREDFIAWTKQMGTIHLDYSCV